MSTKAHWLVFSIKMLSAMIIASTTLFSFMIYGPRIEALYFPVVDKLQDLKYVQQGDDVTITGRMNKFRSCEYIGANWQRVDSNGVSEQLRYISLVPPDDSPLTRPVGIQTIGPVSIIGVTINELKLSAKAEIIHKCHPAWLTITPLYP